MPNSPPPRTTHPKFNAPDADISLVSSDNVVFRLQKANLQSGSVVLRDMLETGTGGNEIAVAEEAKVLEAVLPYCFPEPIAPLDVGLDQLWERIKAFDKYQIGRGLDAAGYACALDAASFPGSEMRALKFYTFAASFDRRRLDAAVAAVIGTQVGSGTALIGLQNVQTRSGLVDDGRLVDLLRRREAALHEAREGIVGLDFADRISRAGAKLLTHANAANALRVWFGSRHCRTADGLERYLDEERREPDAELPWHTHDWMPWVELDDALRALPTDL